MSDTKTATSATRTTAATIAAKLARNHFDTDEEESHIHVDQDIARATGTGPLLVQVCPAGVYSQEVDGTISVEYAACLECGTCRAVAAPGALRWDYPRGGFGVTYREG